VQVVGKRQRDFGRPLALPQPPLDLLLRRDEDNDVSLDDGLAGQRIPGCHVLRGQTLRRATADLPFLDDDRTPAAPPLTTTGHQNVYAGLLGSIA